MKLSERLAPGSILVGLSARTRAELFPALVDALCQAHGIGGSERILLAIEERERKMSTGVGLGIAIPHARLETATGLHAAVGVCPGGLDFPVPDGLPVRVAFLLISPPSAAGLHVQALAAVGRLSKPLIEELVTSPDEAEFLARLVRAEDAAAEISKLGGL